MKLAHTIGLRVFCDDADSEETAQALTDLLAFTDASKPLAIERTQATGVRDNRIVILQSTIEKDAQIKRFFERMSEELSSEDMRTLMDQLATRVDEELNFFIRFDKKSFLGERKLRLTEQGDCFHLTIKLAAFPKKREKALEVAEQILKNTG